MSKVLMKGNEALGEAAIRAGCVHFFGYPITPQTEVPEYLVKRLPEVGGVFVQAESEIASANMIFGAVVDENMGDDLRITVIATGFESNHTRRQLIPQYNRSEKSNGKSATQSAKKQAPVQESVMVGKPNGQPQREQPEAVPEPEAAAAKVESRFSPNNLDIPAFLRRR